MLLDQPATSNQPHFAAALLDPLRTPPDDVARPRCKAATSRYNVYRNNVMASLVEALAAIYPAVQRITGVDFFGAMARSHIRATPPVSPLLFEYGRDFPAFIDDYEPVQDLPWLADTARIERAWLDAYHAADAPSLTVAALAAVGPQRLDDLMFVAHPATHIVRSAYPAVSIFAMNRVDGPVMPLQLNDAEDALVTRPDMEVTVRLLPPGGGTFLTHLIAGVPLAAAATAAVAETTLFDLAANIVGMIEAGAFSGIHLGD